MVAMVIVGDGDGGDDGGDDDDDDGDLCDRSRLMVAGAVGARDEAELLCVLDKASTIYFLLCVWHKIVKCQITMAGAPLCEWI